jgi:hypothetical protein
MGSGPFAVMLVTGALGIATAGCSGTDNVAPVRLPPKPIDIGIGCSFRPEHCRQQFDARGFLNMYLAAAETRARRLGLEIRVTEENGKSLIRTLDERSNRIDVGVRGGRVTRIVELG